MSFKPCKHARCGGMWRYLTGWALLPFTYNGDKCSYRLNGVPQTTHIHRIVKIFHCDRCFSRKAIYPRKGRLVMKSC